MTADREVLREAVLKALPPWAYYQGQDQSKLADAILDAVLDAVLGEADRTVTYDWAARCNEPGGHKHHGPSPIYFMSRAAAERYINNPILGAHELVRRRRFLGDWEPVTA